MERKHPANIAHTYLHEADELLGEIEAAALCLDPDQPDQEQINGIFRSFHTIKGSGAMFGFAEVAGFTHHVESLLDQVREGLVPVTNQLSNAILAATDQIKLLLLAAQGGQPVDSAAQAATLEKILQLSVKSNGIENPQTAAGASDESGSRIWEIEFRPETQLLACGGDPFLLFRDLRHLGDMVVEGFTDFLPPLADLNPEGSYLRWSIRLTTTASENAIRDVFVFVEGTSNLTIRPLELLGDTDQLSPVASAKNKVLQQSSASAPKMNALAAAEPEAGAAVHKATSKEATVRVPAERLDRLVTLVGELVMNHSRLATAAARFQSPDLNAPVEEIERLVSELRDDVLQIRMMPIGSIFGRFRRLVHDLSRELGKEIELVTSGEETELDKSILDQLGEPLVHLLRNSIDHGIENTATRAAKGKPKHGTIRLTAVHQGSDVVVSVEDDGKGLDEDAIRKKAIARQLIAPDAKLTRKEVLNLILLPGFSTAEAVTSVSGRGVGMDVVKRQIDALRGTLNIASQPGQGASMTLTLPLTLAIIEGLLVESGASKYIIPMQSVTENVELPLDERIMNNRRNVIAVRGELIPYIDLRELFQAEGASPPISKIVLVRYEGNRVGIVVDRVMGTHQTVIQALGSFFRGIEVVSGSTVMGDGRVALILDIPGLVRLADKQKQKQPQRAA